MKYYKTLLIWSAVAAIIAMAAVACGENLDPANSPTQVAPRPTLTTTTDTPSATLSLAPTATHLLPLPTYQDGVLEVHGGNEWLNSEGLKIADQTADNKVVLVDFWTYTCVNCIRTLPFLKVRR